MSKKPRPTYRSGVDPTKLADSLQKGIPKAKAEFERTYPNLEVEVLVGARGTGVQEARYAQGRQPLGIVNRLRAAIGEPPLKNQSENFIVTYAKPGQSKHERNPSEAYDVGIFNKLTGEYYRDNATHCYLNYAAIAGRHIKGLQWGGNFVRNGKPFPDVAHFQI